VLVESHFDLDYPKETEIITSPNYTLRFTAADDTQSINVSIDGGSWQPCRKTGLHFWFDWEKYAPGRHEIAAMARLCNGEIEVTDAREVRVEFDRKTR
jgi:hypothetical protein